MAVNQKNVHGNREKTALSRNVYVAVDVEIGMHEDGHPSLGMGKGRITKVFMQEVSESLSSFLSVKLETLMQL